MPTSNTGGAKRRGVTQANQGRTFNPESATVSDALERMRYIVRNSGYEGNQTAADPDVFQTGDGSTYGDERITITARQWERGDKSRTYLTVYTEKVKTRGGRSYWADDKAIEYGYIDNKTGKYVAGKRDLTDDFTLGGNAIK